MVDIQAQIPDPLRNTYRDLVAELDKAIEQVQKNAEFLFSNLEDVCRRIKQFTLALGPRGKDELQRRGTLIETRCGSGSEYDQARSKALESYDGELGREFIGVYRGFVKTVFTALKDESSTPRYLSQVIEVSNNIQSVLDARVEDAGALDTSPAAIQAFKKWRDICEQLRYEAEPLEVDGCRYLYDVPTVEHAKPVIHGGAGVFLKLMKSAAERLVGWVGENAALVPTVATQTPHIANGQLYIDGEPFRLTDPECNVLEAIAERGAMEKGELENISGQTANAVGILRQLDGKYPALKIRFPGGKGKGGYWANVKRCESEPQ